MGSPRCGGERLIVTEESPTPHLVPATLPETQLLSLFFLLKQTLAALPLNVRNMDANSRDAIPEHFSSAEEAGEFWDTHSAADYWDEMEEVEDKILMAAQGWQDPTRWERMKDGSNCPMCLDGHLPANDFSFLVVELAHSYVRLPRNQFMRGWTILILKRHACELYELTSTELAGFFTEVARVAQAVAGIYRPAKLNYGVFGNLCPHIHCHIVVQQVEDDPTKPLHMNEREVLLDDAEYVRMISELARAIHIAT